MTRFCTLRLATLLLLACAPGLAGCGFTPLYASKGVSTGLPAVAVVVPQGRVPYLIREELDDALGHDKSIPPIWRLEITALQTRDPRGLRLDNVAERYDLGLTVKYALISVATGKVEHTGEVTTEVSYDAATAPYAGIAARQDSQSKVAANAARRIQIELAAWMARRSAG
jgi:LPS-assembly lipoprotein